MEESPSQWTLAHSHVEIDVCNPSTWEIEAKMIILKTLLLFWFALVQPLHRFV
jgi:hypothetical protein